MLYVIRLCMIQIWNMLLDIMSCETWCILGDGSGIAVMPSVPILVVCITKEIYVCFSYVMGHLDPFLMIL